MSDENKGNQISESIEEQKRKLKQQIDQLQSTILEIEWSLNTRKFGKTKCNLSLSPSASSSADEIMDLQMLPKCKMQMFSGFYCTKCKEKEIVFTFSPLSKHDTKWTFFVQIICEQDQRRLGRWDMPIGIDLNEMSSSIDFNKGKCLVNFLLNCKRSINAYYARYKQYKNLEDILSDLKSCNIQASLGYLEIILNLLNVYDESTKSCLHITVYLLYKIDMARPYKVKAVSASATELNADIMRHLKKSLKPFKIMDLCEAFKQILNEGPLIWKRENEGDTSPIEIDPLSEESDNGFLAEFSQTQKNSLSSEDIEPNRKRKRTSPSKGVTSNKKTTAPKEKKRKMKKIEPGPAKHNNSNLSNSIQHARSMKQIMLEDTNWKLQRKGPNSQDDKNGPSSDVSTSKNKKLSKHALNVLTSTPKHPKAMVSSNPIPGSDVDISDITITDNKSPDTVKKDKKEVKKKDKGLKKTTAKQKRRGKSG